MNMNYEHSFISGKKISPFGQNMTKIFNFFGIVTFGYGGKSETLVLHCAPPVLQSTGVSLFPSCFLTTMYNFIQGEETEPTAKLCARRPSSINSAVMGAAGTKIFFFDHDFSLPTCIISYRTERDKTNEKVLCRPLCSD